MVPRVRNPGARELVESSVHLPVKSALLQCRPTSSSPRERQRFLDISCEFFDPCLYITADGKLYERWSFDDETENKGKEKADSVYVD